MEILRDSPVDRRQGPYDGAKDGKGWEASLGLRFGTHQGHTIVRARSHRGPLVVQRAFYPEGADLCHVYLLHPPGGLVGADTLAVGVHLEAKARVLVTTPAAGKVYRNGGVRLATAQRHRLTVEAGGSLEWLPQETIVFDGAHVELETRVDLEADAVFVGWEILCLGRPAAGESFSQGRCRQRLELWRDGRPLCIERASVDGGGPLLTAAWGLRGAPVTGTMLATMPATSPAAAAGTDEALAALRALAGALPSGELGSVTRIGEVLVGRYLGASAERARELFGGIWRTVRGQVVGRPASAPRVWDHRLAI